MDLKSFRQQYPQYDAVSDEQLASALHTKYYSNIPLDQFYSKIGLTPIIINAANFLILINYVQLIYTCISNNL